MLELMLLQRFVQQLESGQLAWLVQGFELEMECHRTSKLQRTLL